MQCDEGRSGSIGIGLSRRCGLATIKLSPAAIGSLFTRQFFRGGGKLTGRRCSSVQRQKPKDASFIVFCRCLNEPVANLGGACRNAIELPLGGERLQSI